MIASKNPSRRSLFVKYTEQFLLQGAEKFLSELPKEVLYSFLRKSFDFLLDRDDSPFKFHFSDISLPGKTDEELLTLIEIASDDRPFLVDSLLDLFRVRNTSIKVMFHPIFSVKRNKKGQLEELKENDGGGKLETQIILLVPRMSSGEIKELREELVNILTDLILCVDDFPSLTERILELENQFGDLPDCASFVRLLQWFRNHNFILLGYLPFTFSPGKKGSASPWRAQMSKGLGLFNPTGKSSPHHRALLDQVKGILQDYSSKKPFCKVEETVTISKIHRRENISALIFSPQPSSSRQMGGVLTGLFTHHSLRANVMEIPIVREKIELFLGKAGLVQNSFMYKEALDFLNGLPKLELFRISWDSLAQMLRFFLSVTDQPRIEIGYIWAGKRKSLRVMITIPGGYVPPRNMRKIRSKLESILGLKVRSEFIVRVSTFSIFGLLFFPLEASSIPKKDDNPISRAILEVLQSREAHLLNIWSRSRKLEINNTEASDLVSALPENYKVSHQDDQALADLDYLAKLVATGNRQFSFKTSSSGQGMEVVLYDWELLSLSRIMPILTNLRVDVLQEQAFKISLPGREAFMQKFHLIPPAGNDFNSDYYQPILKSLIFQILDGTLENDPLNALVFSCGFNWRQINLMMLLRNYLMQVGSTYTKSTINETLIRRQETTKALYQVFETRFDPGIKKKERESAGISKEARLAQTMLKIDNLTEDRIFKRMLNLIKATVRTNFFMEQKNPVLAIKLASREVEQLPPPHPLYEIYIHGPLMEGIHLRGGMIARGGLRYSDRPDDFRIEVLGLMSTQMKKNSLIVPVGSKGGFVVKDTKLYGGDIRKAGDEQYKVYISTLLSLTDNLVDGKIKPPENMVRHDGDDPYLVVAADKGTAHLSDTANAISKKAGFWLGDAFASGGSNGYDHKVIGITAKGAWESVKRLFWERNVDLRKDVICLVGIGDMSGDVFGNGLLLSPLLKLVGAFNHAHVFLDPDPDPAISFRERERLFKLPRSSWLDYDSKIISKGGGVFSRQAKAIPLNRELQNLLQVNQTEISGEEAVKALLGMEVDLIWNGGIGTYIKSERETNADVGDTGNDAVRIDAPACRAKVIGEGGNLGLTQAARLDLDQGMVSLNTDAIDNAGGVHMSDQEVNLKILLRSLQEKGEIKTEQARNRLLASLTKAVTEAVLHRNYLQIIAISMARVISEKDVQPFIRLVNLLATAGMLDRRAESIPNSQQFQNFQTKGIGIPRPVLSVLLSTVKMRLFNEMEASSLLDNPFLKKFFVNYFPEKLGKSFDLENTPHPLQRQIIGTALTNLVVDQAGITCIAEVASFTGKSWVDFVHAYLLADEICEAALLRRHIYSLDYKMPAAVQYQVLIRQEEFLRVLVEDLLLEQEPGIQDFDNIPLLRKSLQEYSKSRMQHATDSERVETKELSDGWRANGMSREMAEKTAWFPYLNRFLEASRLTSQWKLTFARVFEFENAIEEQFQFIKLEKALIKAPQPDQWSKQFGDNLIRTLKKCRKKHMAAILKERDKKAVPARWTGSYLMNNPSGWSRYRANLRKAFITSQPNLVALAVIVGILEEI